MRTIAASGIRRRIVCFRLLAALLAAASLLAPPDCSPALAQPVDVVDQRGQHVRLPHPARRIITIPKPMASVVLALDGGSRHLIAMHPASRQSIEEGFLKTVYPEALDIRTDVTRGGTFNPNVETILSLRPDVVIQWTQPAELIKSLEDAGVTVAGLVNSPPDQDINERNLAIVGELLGKGERVAELTERTRRVVERIRTKAAGIPEAGRAKALYFWNVRPTLKPGGRKGYEDYWITLTGGVNAAAADIEGYQTAVNVEQIAAWNPSVIFVGNFDEGTPADFLDNPALAGVDAVKNRRVYKVPHGGYRWDPGSHESLLALEWVAMVMHPDRFDFDLRADMRETYRFLYNHALTDAQIDEILHMRLNGSMAGYERFAKR